MFHVYWCPVYIVDRCKARQAEEARGLFGFHSSRTCPRCRVRFDGWQLWGENGHLQGQWHGDDAVAYLTHRLRYDPQLVATGGGPIYYQGVNLDA